jgi:hypothetical protein
MANLKAHILNNQLAYQQQVRSTNLASKLPWKYSLELDDEIVLNGFLLYSLLLEKSERATTLFLPHDEKSQRFRLQDALAERNKQMEGPGQEAYFHACDLCFFVFEGEDHNSCAFLIHF